MLTDGTLANAGAINAFADLNALHNVDASNTGSIEVQLARQLTLDSTTSSRTRTARHGRSQLTLADATIDQDFNTTAPPAP